MRDEHGVYGLCECGCGHSGRLTQAHICRRNGVYEHDTDPRNLIYILLDCHDVFDNKPLAECYLKLPRFNEILLMMKEFDEAYYNVFTNLRG